MHPDIDSVLHPALKSLLHPHKKAVASLPGDTKGSYGLKRRLLTLWGKLPDTDKHSDLASLLHPDINKVLHPNVKKTIPLLGKKLPEKKLP